LVPTPEQVFGDQWGVLAAVIAPQEALAITAERWPETGLPPTRVPGR
jgi:hypothetical protein